MTFVISAVKESSDTKREKLHRIALFAVACSMDFKERSTQECEVRYFAGYNATAADYFHKCATSGQKITANIIWRGPALKLYWSHPDQIENFR